MRNLGGKKTSTIRELEGIRRRTSRMRKQKHQEKKRIENAKEG